MLGVWAEGLNLSQYCPFTCFVMPKIRSGDYGHGVVELSDEAVSNVALDTQQLLRRLADPGFQPPVLPSIAIELLWRPSCSFALRWNHVCSSAAELKPSSSDCESIA